MTSGKSLYFSPTGLTDLSLPGKTNLTSSSPVSAHFDVTGYPNLKIFKANETTPADVNYWEAHPFDILKGARGVYCAVHFERRSDTDPYSPSPLTLGLGIRPTKPLQFDESLEVKTQKTDQAITRRSKSDVFNDAYLSFHFALKNSIHMDLGPLSNKTRDAFYDWLSLLQQSMPPIWEIQNLLTALVDNFEGIAESEQNLVKLADTFPPPSDKWSQACEKGLKGMGYTCGLWELFHIMTVGVVEYNLMIYDGDHMIIPVDDVSVTLRNYIENFFACEVCRMNFLHGFDTCARDRCTRLHHEATSQKEWVQLPLWLFEFHNGVNVRLMRERAERENWTPTREDEIKAEWPSREECPKCWREDGGWNEDMVYKFLRTEYWLDDAVAGVYRKELSELEMDEDDEDSMPPIALQLLPIFVTIGVGVGWYVKERERRRTGLHKRVA